MLICPIFYELGEFIQLSEFGVNLPFITILGLKKVVCSHINDNYDIDEHFPLLLASIRI